MPVYTRTDRIEGIQYGHIAVPQTEAQYNGIWRDMILENTCNRDAKTESFTGISQHPTPILASSSSSDSTVRADKGNDTLGSGWHQVPRGHQQASWKEGVKNITGIINNQIIHPFKCEEREMVNISTGQKLNLQTW